MEENRAKEIVPILNQTLTILAATILTVWEGTDQRLVESSTVKHTLISAWTFA